jgi:hypothetical protein
MRRRQPHTHYTKGKRVYIKTYDGELHVGKFVERVGRFVVLDIGKFTTRDITGMGYWRAQKLTIGV